MAFRAFATNAVLILAISGVLVSCAPSPETKKPPIVAKPVTFDDLPGWHRDDHAAALGAFLRSCGKPLASKSFLPLAKEDFSAACTAARAIDPDDEEAVQAYFEDWFQPFAIFDAKDDRGLFTGYFEAELRGALQPDQTYNVPIYRLPDDHVTVDLSLFDEQLAGKRIVGRVEAGRLKPYFPRGEISAGALSGRQQELLWVDDVIDAFVLHVQGSGRVILPDGNVVRIGYAGNNGWPYRSIGRALIDRGALQQGQASWGDIRDWLDENGAEADDVLAVNRRYIFFREIEGDGPIGAAGVALTPGRSLAVDPRFLPFGVPVWIDTVWPNDNERPLRRLMVAQDSGNAIRGAVRADFFWGYGAEALAFAGRMKSQGRYFVLLPKTAAARFTGS